MESGVAGEGQLDGGAAERPAHRVLVGVPHDEPEQGARRLLGGGVGVVGAGEVPTDVRRAGLGGVERGLHLVPDERGLRLDVEPGQHEDDLVAEAAEPVEADLEGGRRGLAAHAVDPYPVGALLGEPDGVEPGGDVGARVPGAARSRTGAAR